MTVKMMKKYYSNLSQIGYKHGFKSGLEETTAKQLIATGIKPNYENLKLKYLVPEKQHSYTPDFPVNDRIIIETKGRFLTADRQKMILIKAQYPDIDFRFIFSNAYARINKNSYTTYADWCDKHGFKYAHKRIPQQWITEIKNFCSHQD